MGSVRTFVDEGLGHSSYVIDLGDGAAAIIDPPRFPTINSRTPQHAASRRAGRSTPTLTPTT